MSYLKRSLARLVWSRPAWPRPSDPARRAAPSRDGVDSPLDPDALVAELGGTGTPTAPPDPSGVRQIGVIGHMALGNLILFQPFLRALRRGFPDAEIVNVGFDRRTRPDPGIVAGLVDRDAVLPAPKTITREGLEEMRAACAQAGLRPDILVCRWVKPRDAKTLSLMVATRPRYRVGFVTSGGFVGGLDAAFNVPVAMRAEQHEVERYLQIAALLGCPVEDTALRLAPQPAERAAARHFLREAALPGGPLVGVQTGSSKIQFWKRWPMERWTALAARLAEAGVSTVFLGSAEEREEIAAALRRARLDSAARIANAAGALAFMESAALVAELDVMVAPDSSLMHVAVAVDTDLVALLGPTDINRTRPWTDDCTTIRRPCACNTGTLFDAAIQDKMAHCETPCMAEIDVDEVVAAVFARLEGKRGEGTANG